MPLAFLPARQCFISLLCCPEKKSGLLPAGATGDPQPIAEGGTSWASPAQFPRGALNLAPEIGAVSPDVFTFSEGGLHVGTEHGAARPVCCKAEVLRAPLWHRLPKNWGADPDTHHGAPLCYCGFGSMLLGPAKPLCFPLPLVPGVRPAWKG